MSTLLAAAMLVIVTQNQVPLRAAPREAAPQQALLWQGEVLELRDERGDYLRVYDLKREREGYLRASQARMTTLGPQDAPELLAVARFLRDAPGEEALGISYAAAYLKAVAPRDLTAEPFDAIGVMAERLARRASTRQSRGVETAASAQLEVVAELGVTMTGIEQDDGVQICYDGALFRQVLTMASADAAQQARAALGLTRHECVDPKLGPTARYQYDLWRAQVLDQAVMASAALNPGLRGRVLMRRAGVLAAIAFWQSRRGLNPQLAAERSIADLASVDRSALDADGLSDYADAALRVGASRVAAQTTTAGSGKLVLSTAAARPGETCVSLFDSHKPDAQALIRRCTFATVWSASANSNPDGSALTLAVQPLASWRELWVFRRGASGWTVTVLPAADDGPALGYIEAAGWEPGSRRLLVVRESQINAHLTRRFEIVRLDTLACVRRATSPELVQEFLRWQDPVWRSNTVALR